MLEGSYYKDLRRGIKSRRHMGSSHLFWPGGHPIALLKLQRVYSIFSDPNMHSLCLYKCLHKVVMLREKVWLKCIWVKVFRGQHF